jgi:hypothetical protein
MKFLKGIDEVDVQGQDIEISRIRTALALHEANCQLH